MEGEGACALIYNEGVITFSCNYSGKITWWSDLLGEVTAGKDGDWCSVNSVGCKELQCNVLHAVCQAFTMLGLLPMENSPFRSTYQWFLSLILWHLRWRAAYPVLTLLCWKVTILTQPLCRLEVLLGHLSESKWALVPCGCEQCHSVI